MSINKDPENNNWMPVETAPKDKFVLLCGPSGYTTTPLVFTTGIMRSNYHADGLTMQTTTLWTGDLSRRTGCRCQHLLRACVNDYSYPNFAV